MSTKKAKTITITPELEEMIYLFIDDELDWHINNCEPEEYKEEAKTTADTDYSIPTVENFTCLLNGKYALDEDTYFYFIYPYNKKICFFSALIYASIFSSEGNETNEQYLHFCLQKCI